MKHGHCTPKPSPTYQCWADMRSRCNNKSHQCYKDYGGRGIQVCSRWKYFTNFLEDMGEKPSGLSLDRKNNSKGYYKSNCKWATPSEQQNNTRHNKPVTIGKLTLNIGQWARESGLCKETIFARLRYGWPVIAAITYPVHV